VNDDCSAWSSCDTHAPVSVLHGGKQERGWRSGTENTLLIAALGAACRLAASERQALSDHLWSARSRLLAGLVTHLGSSNIRINGPDARAHTLPNTLNVGLKCQGQSVSAQV
jgi:cysteine sulfinate desulfinase/cysteine desulfurase-like protein